MRVLLAIAVGVCLSVRPVCGQVDRLVPSAVTPATRPAVTRPSTGSNQTAPATCTGQSAAECKVPQETFKKAQEAFRRGQELKRQDPEEALARFDEALRLVPHNLAYASEREMIHQQLIYDHVQRGKELALQQRSVESANEFRRALELDPGNAFAAQSLRDLAQAPLERAPSFIEPSPEEEELVLRPKSGRQTLHLTGDARSAYTQAAAAFGIKVAFDDSTPGRVVRLDLDKVNFAQAMDAIALVTHTFWAPSSLDEVLVAADNAAKHKELDRWVLRTFYLPEASTPQELNDIVNLLRTLFELRLVTPDPANSTITVRGPGAVVKAATKLLQTLWASRPQVMIDVEVYEVTGDMLHTLGLDLPLQFNVFYIPESVITALESSNLQQLLSTTGASGSTLSALLAQAGLSQYASLLQNPIATFGGGNSMGGVGIPALTANFSGSNSRVITLDQVSMRASQGNAATFRFGTRYPVLNASYSSLVPALTSALTGSSSTANSLASFPSFTYEDLGFTLKAKPSIHGDRDVTLDLELELRALGAQVYNSIPTITNRSYKGTITVRNNEPAIVAGALSRSEQESLSGIPGLGRLPGLGS